MPSCLVRGQVFQGHMFFVRWGPGGLSGGPREGPKAIQNACLTPWLAHREPSGHMYRSMQAVLGALEWQSIIVRQITSDFLLFHFSL